MIYWDRRDDPQNLFHRVYACGGRFGQNGNLTFSPPRPVSSVLNDPRLYLGGAAPTPIGGYERIMGPNGQAQYWARDLGEACHILLRHYEHTYVAPGERFPRRAVTTDPTDRDVRTPSD